MATFCFSKLVGTSKSESQSSIGLADSKGEFRDSRFRKICKKSAFTLKVTIYFHLKQYLLKNLLIFTKQDSTNLEKIMIL